MREAANGAEGLDELAEAKPAVMLLDLMMPEMNGFEMLRTMRRERGAGATSRSSIITSKDLSRDELRLAARQCARGLPEGRLWSRRAPRRAAEHGRELRARRPPARRDVRHAAT